MDTMQNLCGRLCFDVQLMVHCVAKLESESSRFTDELNSYRTYLYRKRLHNGSFSEAQLLSAGCGKMNKGRGDFIEEGDKYQLIGRRYRPLGRENSPAIIYDVCFKVRADIVC